MLHNFRLAAVIVLNTRHKSEIPSVISSRNDDGDDVGTEG